MGDDPYIGKEIAGFLLSEKLGEGGMGAVYLANQTRLARPVAFKILPTSIVVNKPRFLKRFIREAKAAARLSHQNVVQVYDAGSEEEIHYIAMEYVAGVGLNVLLRKIRSLTEAEAVYITLQAARGLKAASAKGVVHRDIKPANLMISKGGNVKVADFGLAKDLVEDAPITAKGHIMGTPSYMSPEQCQAKPVDYRSDQYSLGVTFFEMLAGRRPFIADSSMAIINMHCTEPPPDVRKFRPEITEGTAAILQRMMAKEPMDRYQDFEELTTALEEVRRHLTDTSPADTPTPSVPSPARPLDPVPDEATKKVTDAGDSTLLRLVEAIPTEIRKVDVIKSRILSLSEASSPTPAAGREAESEKEILLELRDVYAGYGRIEVLHGIHLTVGLGEVVTLIGANGAGKSTVLNTICGLVRSTHGEIFLDGEPIESTPPSSIAGLGIAQVPEGRRLFPDMTVRENLEMGAYLRSDRESIEEDMDWVFTLFPILEERIRQLAGSLSGGEQQMCAIARGLMARPKILLLDEPSLGLAPLLVEQIFEIIRELNKTQGTTILLVEQNARMALRVSRRAYVLETGSVTVEGPSERLAAMEEIRMAYLGGCKETP